MSLRILNALSQQTSGNGSGRASLDDVVTCVRPQDWAQGNTQAISLPSFWLQSCGCRAGLATLQVVSLKLGWEVGAPERLVSQVVHFSSYISMTAPVKAKGSKILGCFFPYSCGQANLPLCCICVLIVDMILNLDSVHFQCV